MNPRALRVFGPVLLVLAALASVFAGLAYGGGAAPQILLDAGPVVRWGLPVVKMLVNLAAAGMIGSLVLALFALKPGQRAFEIALDLASAAAAVFTVAAGATGFLTFVQVTDPQIGLDAGFGAQLGSFLVERELGQAWLVTTIAGAVITVLAFAVRGWLGTALTALVAIAAIVPMVTQGHAGDLANHNIAVSALFLHVLGASVWVGGLLLVVLVRPVLRGRIVDVLTRYSTLALASFVVVALSGLARAVIGIGTWAGLASPYGVLVVIKSVLLVLMGIAGALYRRRLIARVADEKRGRPFWRLVTLELVLMGAASGVAAALARTAPPTGLTAVAPTTPAQRLTGSPLPPELTLDRWFTQWNPDLLWLVAVGFGAVFYIVGLRRLSARGDRWPVHRTVFWLAGLALLLWVTCGPMAAYGDYLFSIHMLGHMLLTMAVPLCLVSGAPVTLALRAIRKRTDGTRGGREWILWAVHSPYSRVVTHPVVAAVVYVASLWIFYFTDLFRWSVYDHLGHEWMIIHFLITGYLFMLSLVGIDPVPKRMPYPGRLITLIAAAAIHAFFGVALMMQTGLMLPEWFGAMARPWGPTPMEDQYIGGGIAWSIGEIPNLIVAITLAIQWSRSDERAQRSRDRHADRTGDTELAEYNAKLAALAERDERVRG
ncbi:cytochrome c oxidase assembly protein [Microbacterium gorillae]|uniref:cytochrome c oxidase assembly protein n=1 Tax=Microbacterium gorillae TaxID=1231063 RepID=UPI0005910C5D|nr:cytochrome c oxidase assembly protein [Microbacterium gorillae]